MCAHWPRFRLHLDLAIPFCIDDPLLLKLWNLFAAEVNTSTDRAGKVTTFMPPPFEQFINGQMADIPTNTLRAYCPDQPSLFNFHFFYQIVA